jgi:hypothetical protein
MLATQATETFLGAPPSLTFLVGDEVAVDDIGEASLQLGSLLSWSVLGQACAGRSLAFNVWVTE